MTSRPQHLPVSAYSTIGLSELLVKIDLKIIAQPYCVTLFQRSICIKTILATTFLRRAPYEPYKHRPNKQAARPRAWRAAAGS